MGLQEMRERTGLTVDELSERSGITAARIEAVERVAEIQHHVTACYALRRALGSAR